MDIPDEIRKRLVFKEVRGYEAEPPRLVEVLYDPQPCDDCGTEVQNRILHIKRCESPYPHTRQYCKTCEKYRNPLTGEFDCDVVELNRIYRNNYHLIVKG